MPVDPSTATQLTPELIRRLAAGARPELAKLIAGLEPGFPLWDEVAAAVWLDPGVVTRQERLYVDVDTQFGPGYGDMLSWRENYQPGLGEQPAEVIETVDPAKVEALMLWVLAARVPAK